MSEQHEKQLDALLAERNRREQERARQADEVRRRMEEEKAGKDRFYDEFDDVRVKVLSPVIQRAMMKCKAGGLTCEMIDEEGTNKVVLRVIPGGSGTNTYLTFEAVPGKGLVVTDSELPKHPQQWALKAVGEHDVWEVVMQHLKRGLKID